MNINQEREKGKVIQKDKWDKTRNLSARRKITKNGSGKRYKRIKSEREKYNVIIMKIRKNRM